MKRVEETLCNGVDARMISILTVAHIVIIHVLQYIFSDAVIYNV